MPAFTVDSEVEFEVSPFGDAPRWCLNRDLGYTGKWAQGLVTCVSEYAIEVFAFFPDGHTQTITFPNYMSSDFETRQWEYPGYLRLIKDLIPSCDCGCKDIGYHWNFCAKGQWEKKNGSMAKL